jgi:hypothetical protein
MSDNIVEKILDDSYDESREYGYMAMVREFCSRRMRWVAVLVWAFAIVFFAAAAYCAIRFLYADQAKAQIMYAALFVLFVEGIALMKIFAWQMLVRNSITREIKRLELRVAELGRTLAGK